MDSIEKEIQEKGLVAPRVTPADIQDAVESEHYFTAAQGVAGAYADNKWGGLPEGHPTEIEYIEHPESLSLLTFCVLCLKNGFTVTGESACASPENFDAELGRKISRRNAEAKIWPLLGYELRSKLSSM